MENNRSSLSIYRDKTSESHSFEEIKEAFDKYFSICLKFDPAGSRSKFKLIANITRINPDVIVQKIDFCKISRESFIERDQILIINKNADAAVSNEIGRAIEESGFVESAYCFFGESEHGYKRCYNRIIGNIRPFVVKKANMLNDGNHILVTVRSITRADRQAEEESAEQSE